MDFVKEYAEKFWEVVYRTFGNKTEERVSYTRAHQLLGYLDELHPVKVKFRDFSTNGKRDFRKGAGKTKVFLEERLSQDFNPNLSDITYEGDHIIYSINGSGVHEVALKLFGTDLTKKEFLKKKHKAISLTYSQQK